MEGEEGFFYPPFLSFSSQVSILFIWPHLPLLLLSPNYVGVPVCSVGLSRMLLGKTSNNAKKERNSTSHILHKQNILYDTVKNKIQLCPARVSSFYNVWDIYIMHAIHVGYC